MCYIIEIMNDDYYVFSSSNHHLKKMYLLYCLYDDDIAVILYHKCSVSFLSCREDGLYLKREVQKKEEE